jgi:hypothetical protein
MELAALEESAELLDAEAIGGHVGILGVPFPETWCTTRSESPKQRILRLPISLASLSPCTRASYSVMLFDARKWICSTHINLSPLGEVKTMSAPKPPSILDPSKFMRQYVEFGAGGRYWFSPYSAKKSAMM